MIRRLFARALYRLRNKLGLQHSFREAVLLWSHSNAIYIGPTGPSGIVLPEAEAFRQIVGDGDISNDQLETALSNSSPWVVGYCFEALLARGYTPNLSPMLLDRIELVSMGVGCIRIEQALGQYVQSRLTAEIKRRTCQST